MQTEIEEDTVHTAASELDVPRPVARANEVHNISRSGENSGRIDPSWSTQHVTQDPGHRRQRAMAFAVTAIMWTLLALTLLLIWEKLN